MGSAVPGWGPQSAAPMPENSVNEAKKTSLVVLVVRQLAFVVMCHLTEVKFENRLPAKMAETLARVWHFHQIIANSSKEKIDGGIANCLAAPWNSLPSGIKPL
jgi:hypothetical protein